MKKKAISPVLTVLFAVAFGFFLGISVPVAITPKVNKTLVSSLVV
jgi:hypothetical protein